MPFSLAAFPTCRRRACSYADDLRDSAFFAVIRARLSPLGNLVPVLRLGPFNITCVLHARFRLFFALLHPVSRPLSLSLSFSWFFLNTPRAAELSREKFDSEFSISVSGSAATLHLNSDRSNVANHFLESEKDRSDAGRKAGAGGVSRPGTCWSRGAVEPWSRALLLIGGYAGANLHQPVVTRGYFARLESAPGLAAGAWARRAGRCCRCNWKLFKTLAERELLFVPIVIVFIEIESFTGRFFFSVPKFAQIFHR